MGAPFVNPEPTSIQKFETLTRRLMSVPKTEFDRRGKDEHKERDEPVKTKGS